MNNHTLVELLNNFIKDSENADNNIRLAVYYYNNGR
jgi:hypothetical protein